LEVLSIHIYIRTVFLAIIVQQMTREDLEEEHIKNLEHAYDPRIEDGQQTEMPCKSWEGS
jgi:hypothetical protein